MSYHHFYSKLDRLARDLFPSLKELPEVPWSYMISPLEITIPESVRNDAQRAIAALFRLSRLPDYQKQLTDVGQCLSARAQNQSVLMAYDFHTTEDGRCYLVEINTNASGFWLASLMHLVHRDQDPTSFEPVQRLAAAFENELRLQGKPYKKPSLVITDDDIPSQKMYPEFLMYKDWFAKLGWQAQLCEAKDLAFVQDQLRTEGGQAIDFVYNRLTDFYLEDSTHSALREAYQKNVVCVSPHPREYWLLADKQRLVQLSQPGFLETTGVAEADKQAIERVLLPTFEKSDFESLDEIWTQRKTLFFKPKRSHGGKSAYRGESVSRKVFERLMQEDILIQKYMPAQRIPIADPRSVLQNWKFDLRFFVYGEEVQLAAARAYQGQVTNFASPMGGFALI